VRARRAGPGWSSCGSKGIEAVSDDSLKAILFTERAGRLRRWFGFNVGPTACLDSLELRDDMKRIELWYSWRGYPGTTADVTTRSTGERTTTVRFRVREAPPVRVDSVRLEGLPPRVVDERALVADLRGRAMDDTLILFKADSIRDRLRDAGYVRARRPRHTSRVDSAARRAQVTLRFEPGGLARFGEVEIEMTANDPARPAIPEQDVRTLLRIKPGEVYLPRAVAESQQTLFGSGVYRTVTIDSIGNGGSTGDTIPVRVRLAEGRHHSLRGGGGWGTLDCFRTQTRYIGQNFLGRAHRLQLDARLAKIGVGAPLDGFNSLCAPQVKNDLFSQELNYYAGGSVQLRGVIGQQWRPQLTLYSERRTEVGSYVRETNVGAIASVERALIPRISTVFTYRFDNGRTTSDQAVACFVFGLCRFNDRVLLQSPSRLHAAGVTFSRSAPALGSVVINDERWAIETRLGTLLVRDLHRTVNFNRTQLEYALYRPLTRWLVGAARIQAGAVLTRRDLEPLVPPQERFYSGGQNSVRGFGQNQLGPSVYVVGAPQDTLVRDGYTVGEVDPARGFQRLSPAGGTATALLNFELRTRDTWPSNLLRWVIFVDAGRVWNSTGNYSVSGLRVTPGLGVRLDTPLGPFRVDIGYNPYSYESGPAFFLQPRDVLAGTQGRAICVAPGTLEPLDAGDADALGPVGCPASFRPPDRRGLLPRLAFHFSIGEAF
jgi:hypothetical protein